MLYRKVECPTCGNEIVVNGGSQVQKCCYCRRLMTVKFYRRKPKSKKLICEVEAMDFPEPQTPKSYSNWRDKDIYGK